MITGPFGFKFPGSPLVGLAKLADNQTNDVTKATCKAFAKYILNKL